MSGDIISIAQTGVDAAQEALATISSNIANASDANYSTESVNLAPLVGAAGASDGVQVTGIQAARLPFINSQINEAQSQESYNTSYAQLAQIGESFLSAQSGQDLGATIQNVFNAFTNLSASPEDMSVRQSVLSAAQSFAQQSQTIDNGLAQTESNALAGLPSVIGQVNDLAGQMAQLNTRIQSAEAAGGPASSGAPALVDERNATALQLANLVGASTDSNGNVTIGGMPLVSGSQAFALELSVSGTGATLQIKLPQGDLALQNSQAGGQVGGTIAAVSAISQAMAQVNDLVDGVANAINQKQQTGYGLDGSTGNPLFVIPSGGGPIQVSSSLTLDQIAAAQTAAGVPGDGSNAAAIAGLQNSNGLDAQFPDSTAAQAWSQLSATFGAQVQNATQQQSQAQDLLQSLQQLQSSVSGVSLNQQLTMLLQYQNALEASGRAISVGLNLTQFLLTNLP
jgi:flagellar hook-associated protein 1 FlgK